MCSLNTTLYHLPVLEMLLRAGADVDAHDKDGRTGLMIAAMYGQTEVVEFLLRKGADVHLKDTRGETARTLAQKANHPDVIALLKKAETQPKTP